MHAYGRRGEGIVGGERERAPILAAVVGGVLRARDDVVPPVIGIWLAGGVAEGGSFVEQTYSRIFVSDGWAVMYGGGFSVIALYSRVNWRSVSD